jgi:hypothetical protein
MLGKIILIIIVIIAIPFMFPEIGHRIWQWLEKKDKK